MSKSFCGLSVAIALALDSPAWAGSFAYDVLPHSAGFSVNALGDGGQVAAVLHKGPSPGGHTIQLLWTPEPAGHYAIANVPMIISGINAKGIAVGSRPTSNPGVGYDIPLLYRIDTGRVHRLVGIPPNQGATVVPEAISADGVVIGLLFYPGGHAYYSFLLDGRKFSDFEAPNSGGTNFTSINDRGLITGFASTATTQPNGFIFQNGTFTNFAVPSSHGVMPRFITDEDVVGGIFVDTAGVTRGFTYDGTNTTIVSYPAASSVSLVGIGPSGEIFGDAMVDGKPVAFIDINDQFTIIQFPGGTTTRIAAVNASGTIAGSFTDAAGISHAFRATCPLQKQPCTH